MADLAEDFVKHDLPDYISQLFESNEICQFFTDVTLAVAGTLFEAHKIVLSASSFLFENLLKDIPDNVQPCLIFPDLDAEYVVAVMNFMYCGTLNCDADKISEVLNTASFLQIKGLKEIAIENLGPLIYEANLAVEDSHMELVNLPEVPLITAVPDNQSKIEDAAYRPNDIFKTSKTVRKRRRPLYGEGDLKLAVEEVRTGAKLSNTAAKYSIPVSTLHVRAKDKGALTVIPRTEHSIQDVSKAMQAVQDGLSLKEAGDLYNIPKTVLWRRLHFDLQTCQILSKRRKLQNPLVKDKITIAVKRGETISSISRKYQVPVATVFKVKESLVKRGLMDPSCIKRTSKETVKKAVQAVLCGNTLSQAAVQFQVPRTTLWRHLHGLTEQDIEQEALSVDGGTLDDIHDCRDDASQEELVV